MPQPSRAPGIEDTTGCISCDLTAIPAEERQGHIALVRELFANPGRGVREIPDGLELELPATRLGDAFRFMENERRCCRHLAFGLTVPPDGAPLTLSVTGPGAREELRALANQEP